MDDDRGVSPETAQEEDILVWQVRRCTQKPFLCALVALLELVLVLSIYGRWGAPFAAFALVFLTVALLPFYCSYRYVLTPEWIEVCGPLYTVMHRWNEFDGWRHDQDELWLTSRAMGSRKVLVIYSPRNMDLVVRYVQGHIPIKLEDGRL